MNELEFIEPDDEEQENAEIDLKRRRRNLFDAVQTFAPEYNRFPKAYEILWYGSAN